MLALTFLNNHSGCELLLGPGDVPDHVSWPGLGACSFSWLSHIVTKKNSYSLVFYGSDFTSFLAFLSIPITIAKPSKTDYYLVYRIGCQLNCTVDSLSSMPKILLSHECPVSEEWSEACAEITRPKHLPLCQWLCVHWGGDREALHLCRLYSASVPRLHDSLCRYLFYPQIILNKPGCL